MPVNSIPIFHTFKFMFNKRFVKITNSRVLNYINLLLPSQYGGNTSAVVFVWCHWHAGVSHIIKQAASVTYVSKLSN